MDRDAGDVARQNDSTDDEWAAYAQRLAISLRRAREHAGLSQEQVAYRAGLTRYTYQKYEKGESRPGSPANPTLRTLLAAFALVVLADLLWIDPARDPRAEAQVFVKNEKGEGGEDFTTVPAVLDGVRDILSERWAEDAALVSTTKFTTEAAMPIPAIKNSHAKTDKRTA